MKSNIRKKVLVILLCMVMVISGTNFGFADGAGDEPADQAATTTEQLDLSGDAETPQEPGTDGEEAGTEIGVPGEDASTEVSITDISETEASSTEMPSTEQGTEAAADGPEQNTETPVGAEEAGNRTDEPVSGQQGENQTSQTMGELPEELPDILKLDYEDEQVKVSVEAETAGIIPKGASLKVVPILPETEETGAQYKEVEAKLLEKAENEAYDIAGFLAYDISFVNDKGEKLEPNGEVKVSMEYKEAAIPEEVKNAETDAKDMDVTVMHLEEDEKGEVQNVVDLANVPEEGQEAKTPEEVVAANKIESLETTEGKEVQKTEFVTDGFSVFTITWTNVSKTVNAYFYDTEGNEITLSDPDKYKITLSTANTEFAVSDIKEGSLFYEIVSDGTTYRFSKILNIWDVSGKTIKEQILSGAGTETIKFSQTSTTTGWGYTTYTAHWYDVSGTDRTWDSQDKFYFIYENVTEIEPVSPPDTVETIDSTSLGVEIYMKNYDFDNGNPVKNSDDSINYFRTGIHAALGGPWVSGDGANAKQGLVQSQLNANGYPQTVGGTVSNPYKGQTLASQSLESWFTGGRSANYLFRKSDYDANGTFYYSSFDNYAYFDEAAGRFTLYDAVATPKISGNTGTNATSVIYNQGHFFPYNNAMEDPVKSANVDRFDENWKEKDEADRKQMYYVSEPDFHFSMYLKASFIQSEGGKIESKDGEKIPMTYSFTGDDDLWVFIDDKLVLDLGGIHDAASGEIDFSTGTVTYGRNSGKTGSEVKFESIFDAENLENGTFKDYSSHTLKMFYLERNTDEANGGSGLKVSFNLPTVKPGTVEVKKSLTNTDKEEYANQKFGFKIYAQKEKRDGNKVTYLDEYEEITPETYDYGSRKKISFELVDKQEGEELEYDSSKKMFYLKPGRSAQISGLAQNRKYYVEEVLESSKYDHVKVNAVDYVVDEAESSSQDSTKKVVKTVQEEVQKQPLVIFRNNCSKENERELCITKRMDDGEGKNFQVKVWLENIKGELEPVSDQYQYYLQKEGDSETYYTIDASGQPVELNGEGYCGYVQKGGIITIPVGYTAKLNKILADTIFYVEEVFPVDTKYKYQEPEISIRGHKEVEATESLKEIKFADSNTTIELPASKTEYPGLGSIELGQDAEVTITNHLITGIPDIPNSTDGSITKTMGAKDEKGYPITLEVKTREVKTGGMPSNADVLFIIDVSGSMNDNNRMTQTKTAAKAFVSNFVNDAAKGKHRVGIVSFATDATEVLDFSNQADIINRKIDALVANGGTNTDAGLYRALQMINSRTGEDKNNLTYVILLTDGVPTYYRTTRWGYEQVAGPGNTWSKDTYNSAVSSAVALKNVVNKVYTIGLLSGLSGTDLEVARTLLASNNPEHSLAGYSECKKMDSVRGSSITWSSTPSTYSDGYFEIMSTNGAGDELKSIWEQLSNTINKETQGSTGDGWTVTDKMESHVAFQTLKNLDGVTVNDHRLSISADGKQLTTSVEGNPKFVVAEYDDASGTLKWHLNAELAEKSVEYNGGVDYTYTFTYYVTLEDTGSTGISNTNDSTVVERGEDKPLYPDKMPFFVNIVGNKTDESGGLKLENAEFGLYKDPELTQLISTGKSDDKGHFAVQIGQSDFEKKSESPENYELTVYLKETKAPNGFQCDSTVHVINVKANNVTYSKSEKSGRAECTDVTVELDPTAPASNLLTIDNQFVLEYQNRAAVEWQIIKVSVSNHEFHLQNAKFGLYQVDNDGQVAQEASYTGTSDEYGQIIWDADVSSGTYRLKELKAPIGYSKSGLEYQITVNTTSVDVKMVNANGTLNDMADNLKVSGVDNAYYYENEVVYSLPSAGRGGIYWYMISGVLFMMASGLILYIQKSKYAGRCWKI